jgi:hypothetical protein
MVVMGDFERQIAARRQRLTVRKGRVLGKESRLTFHGSYTLSTGDRKPSRWLWMGCRETGMGIVSVAQVCEAALLSIGTGRR